MLKSKAVILVKLESSYATDPVPTYAANAILCENPEIEVINKKIERNNVKPFYGAKPFVSLGEGLKFTFLTELKGSGVAPPSTPPEIGVLFRASNFTETIVATPGAECVKYNPNSSPDGESCTIYFYRHNMLHKALGCRGAGPDLDGKVNEYGKVKWEFHGIYGGVVDASIPTAPVFNTTKPPLFRSAAFALDTYAAVIETFKLSVKNAIGKRMDANAATGIVGFFVKERQVTGEIDPEMVPKATKDFWGMWESGSVFAATATFGSAAGNRCVISSAGAQLDALKYGDRENILTVGMPLVYEPSVAGDDEIEFKFN